MTRSAPAQWTTAQPTELAGVRAVCFDIDDTLSTGGRLTADAYRALWSLAGAGYPLVPITGRPAGWCDHFARFWPVDAVIGENGAFAFYMEGGRRRRIDTPGVAAEPRAQLDELARRIKERFPHARWASDQPYREFDLAIDICEDVPAWPREDVDELLALCEREGAHAKLSSIHVNAWFGDYDKRRGLRNWLESGAPGLQAQPVPAWEEWLFIGDSPNDEPLFEVFDYSVGVANLGRYLDRLKHPPRWITGAENGAGFVEMAERLVALRG